ncbi:preprotein translocase subunit SecG [Patescibacteria group bacterium]|nr:preprotein translocase subunit SecG [Patescibacteria group bacterium]MBU1473236.1 preprotein translocase subunit SecG [Patescibacteria group bacterium]MBU2459492.1 preprotein translocase subunit SecG [Patescibacteria group bacterium]MBU2544151.1 preprotein translocase subunit SecG [Patescibacteria group bacterium]
MKTFVIFAQIIVAVILSVLVLLQSSKGGLGNTFGSLDFYRTRRGAEKVVFLGTIIFAVIFLMLSIVNLLIQ